MSPCELLERASGCLESAEAFLLQMNPEFSCFLQEAAASVRRAQLSQVSREDRVYVEQLLGRVAAQAANARILFDFAAAFHLGTLQAGCAYAGGYLPDGAAAAIRAGSCLAVEG